MPELVNVPNVDGVPAVLFAPGAGGDILLAAADAVGLPIFPGLGPQWGLFANGAPVVTADNVVAFDFKSDYAIADFPLERGAFESYNKVQIPFDVRLVFTAGLTEANRTGLLASLEAIQGDLNLYDAVTPEKVYPNVNVLHVDYHRTAQSGAGLLVVSVWCQEIRLVSSSSSPSATGNTGDTAAPSGADQTNSGTVQATDVGAQPNATATLADQSPNTVATPLTGTNATAVPGTNATATELTGTNVTATPIDGTSIGTATQQGVPLANATPLSTAQTAAVPATSSSISGLQAAGPDQYSTFGVAP